MRTVAVAEALVDGQRAADALRRAARDRHRVALDDQVQLARDLAQQGVADRAADDVHAGLARDRGQHQLGSGRRPQRVHAPHIPLTPAATLQRA